MRLKSEFVNEVFLGVMVKLGHEYIVSIEKVVKNNNRELIGLQIRKTGEQIAPVFYLDGYFEDSRYTISEVVDEVISSVSQAHGISEDLGTLLDYAEVRDKLRFNVINYDANQGQLKDIPHIKYLDLAIVFYLLLEKSKEGQMTTVVHNTIKDLWEVTDEQLYIDSMKNMMVYMPAHIENVSEVIKEIAKESMGEEYDEELFDLIFDVPEDMDMYVLSNDSKSMGAACMLYESVLKEFSDKLGSNLIILPSSVHEVILIRQIKDMAYEDCSCIVKDINIREVPVQERLSNSAYLYDRVKRQLSIAFQGEEVCK